MSKHNALTTFGRSGNPMFRGEAFKPDATFAETEASGRMTLAGTVNKTGILLVLCLVTASFTWNIFSVQVLQLPSAESSGSDSLAV